MTTTYPPLDPTEPVMARLVDWGHTNAWMPYVVIPVGIEDRAPNGDIAPVALALIRQVFAGHAIDTTRAVVIMICPDSNDVRVWCCPEMWEKAVTTEGAWWHRSLPVTAVTDTVERDVEGWLTQPLRGKEVHDLPDGWVPTPLRNGQWCTRYLALT